MEGSSSASIIRDEIASYLSKQTLRNILPTSAQAKLILEELKGNEEAWTSGKAEFERVASSLERRVREEKRSIKDLLGKDTTKRLLDAIEQLDVYDTQAVTGFLKEPAIEKILGSVLYEGIFEFLQRIGMYVWHVYNACMHHAYISIVTTRKQQ
jgi:hypothetical protein